MSKRTCVLFFLIVGLAATVRAQQPVTLFVSPSGNDLNSGNIDQPFATLKRAMDTVRKIRRSQKRSAVTVFLRQGTYTEIMPLTFHADDGGDSSVPVIYAAYGREKVTLSGGSVITQWTRQSDGKWVAPIPTALLQAGSFQALYKNGNRLPRGRFPAGDSLLTIKTISPDYKVITVGQEISLPRLHGTRTEVVVLTNWNMERVILDSAVGRTLYLHDPAAWVGHCCAAAGVGMPLYLENAPGFVHDGGSWYADESKGWLTYLPAPNEDPSSETFVAPLARKLVLVEGSARKPVLNLHFRGIDFCYAAFPLPDSGYRGLQAGYYGFRYQQPPVYMEPSAIDLIYASQSGVEGCTVAHVGAGGIGIGEGCRRVEVVGAEVYDAGGNGIIVGQRDRKLRQHNADWDRPEQAPENTLVYNNYVHDCAATQFGDVGIFAAFCANTTILRNTVAHLPYTGISLGFIWDSIPTTMKNCTVAFNDVHDVMRLLADGGAIYTLGWEPGTTLNGNLLYNVHRSSSAFGGAPNNAIFFDECTRGIYVTGNISYSIEDTSALRFNRCTPAQQTWGTNSFAKENIGSDFLPDRMQWVGSTLVEERKKE
jgi:hypothetical protein